MTKIITFYVILLSLHIGYNLSDEEWWHSMSLYQIYLRSFKDSDGDGIGDLKGLIDKLEHFQESNVDAFWLSPIYPSPMNDSGYDISDFVAIASEYGTMEDFEDLVKIAHRLGLKVIMDFVPNHSSDQHEWFQKSLRGIQPYTNFYVWHKGKMSGGRRTVPNNWVSVFGGPAWKWSNERNAYYLHQFSPKQPDLNYNNRYVINEMKNVMRFWLDKGIDGFRVDAVPHLYENDQFLDEPLSSENGDGDPNNYDYTKKIYTKDQLHTYEMVREWRQVLDEYSTEENPKIMMIEAYSNFSMTMKYYKYGAHFPFNFGLITDTNRTSKASNFKKIINKWINKSPSDTIVNWVAGNHDQSRLVTRYGPKLAKAITVLTLLLPGVSVTYNGEEIGMEDNNHKNISCEETKDTLDNFEPFCRDRARTPFQWDTTTSAGFSTNNITWLPVNENYKRLNLVSQEEEKDSYYSLYKTISSLKREIIENTDFKMKIFNDNILAFSRKSYIYGQPSVYVAVNFGEIADLFNMSSIVDRTEELSTYYSTNDDDCVECPDTSKYDGDQELLFEHSVTVYIGRI